MSVFDNIDREILSFFRKIEDKSTDYINKLITSSFVTAHRFQVSEKSYIYQYLINTNDGSLCELNKIIGRSPCHYGMEELVEIFEFVISPADKEVNGAVYTPGFIRDFIIKQVLARCDKNNWCHKLYADLSCGCGGFFYTLLTILKEQNPKLSIKDFVRHNLIGVDIKEYSVERTKILLSLYALSEGEELKENDFNILCQNTLSYSFIDSDLCRRHKGIDIVIGNPPYVASSKMSEENRQYVKNWAVSKIGKSDLYLPFFQIGLECLKEGGVLGYITVNSFYRSLNGSAFRSYLSNKGYECTIVDFGSEQLFKGCSTYTCICLIERRPTGKINYHETSSKNLSILRDELFEQIPYSKLDDKKGWILKDKNTTAKIQKIEKVGKALDEVVDIKNGFATLRNDIFLITPNKADSRYFYFEKKGKGYQVERSICREAIKANIVREESDLLKFKQYIIYPYRTEDGQQRIIEEDYFQRDYPFAYDYLSVNKDDLAKRDNGHKEYPKWYAYGRSQALNLRGERLLFPHICNFPCFVYCGNENLMYYDGYAIFANNSRKVEITRRILSSNIFWYYITKTSKPYSGGFFSLEKRYIRHFGMPDLTEEQEEELLSFANQDELNRWIECIYGINI